MCLTCNCGDPRNDHGDPRRLTSIDVAHSAAAEGIKLKKARKRIHKALKLERKLYPVAKKDDKDKPKADKVEAVSDTEA